MRSLLAALSCLLFVHGAHADAHIIAVSGSAEKSLEPNMITLTVEIWSKNSTAKQAQALAATEYQRVKKVFENFKIKKEDINTDSYSLNPEYIYDAKTQQNKMVGFRAVQALNVTFRKVEDAGSFLDALSTAEKKDAGVNINNLRWDSDKRASVEVAGLGDAVQNARLKADEIAKAAGVKIKAVARISHNVSSDNPPVPFRGGMMKMSASTNAPTELAAGAIKIHVEVQAEYEIN